MKINKLYEKTKDFIKKYYKSIIGVGILVFLYTFELNYEIYTSGKPINLDKRITVENAYSSEGNFYLTYVEARPGIIPFALLSFVIPSWDLVSLDNFRIENEEAKEIALRGKIDLESVNDYAIKNAFDLAGVDYIVEKEDLIVYHVFEEAKTDLKVGDIIRKVNGKSVGSMEDLTSSISNNNVGDKVLFEIERKGKTLEKEGRVLEGGIIGLYLVHTVKVDPSIEVEFNYNSNESGPSGGLMSALEIYNQLTEKDITKGKKIAGTGTITYDGKVGAIGGVKYKLAGAVKDKAEVFIVPSGENYEEALKLVNEKKYAIDLIEAENFKDVIKKLQSY